MLLTWRSTVLSLSTSAAAIALLVSPEATRRSTSSSRGLSPCVSRGAARQQRVHPGESGRAPSSSNTPARPRAPALRRRGHRAPRRRARRERVPSPPRTAPRAPATAATSRAAPVRASEVSPRASATAPRACADIAPSASLPWTSEIAASSALRARPPRPRRRERDLDVRRKERRTLQRLAASRRRRGGSQPSAASPLPCASRSSAKPGLGLAALSGCEAIGLLRSVEVPPQPMQLTLDIEPSARRLAETDSAPRARRPVGPPRARSPTHPATA